MKIELRNLRIFCPVSNSAIKPFSPFLKELCSSFIITRFLSKFRKIIVTPHVLAEVSNLINTRVHKSDFADFIEKIIEILSDFKEVYVQKDEIISREELKKVGITDTGILLACERDNNLILTKDFLFKVYVYQRDCRLFILIN